MFAVRGGGVKMKIITGERSIGIMSSRWVMRALLHDKAPVDFIVPREGGPAFLKNAAILKDAPHPNCARLFMDYFLSREKIEFFRDAAYEIGTRDDFVPKENKVTMETYKNIWPLNADKFMKEIGGFIDEFSRIFGL
jgi:iron(III) transport system substrate-binding protein